MRSKIPRINRKSCNLCRRQKRKCDLQSRLENGVERCSRCAERDHECHFGSSDDTYANGRKSLQRCSSNSEPLEEPGVVERCDSLPSLSPEVTAATILFDESPSSQFSGSFLEPCSEHSLFLQRVFGNHRPQNSHATPLAESSSDSSSSESQNTEKATTAVAHEFIRHDTRSGAFRSARSHFFQLLLDEIAHPGATFPSHLVDLCGDTSVYVESLHAYFDFPGLYRPFVPEHAFWLDFYADRCSPALLSAIACCGISYTKAADKWKKQQRLAITCMKHLMKTEAVKTGSIVRLDDLEAIALLIDFKFDRAHKPPTTIWKRFMSHDALVLMSLQSRNRAPRKLDPSAALAHVDERFTLLYWDVFGRDAFRCLNQKSTSLILDHNPGSTEDFLRREAGSYLDAILSLSIVARQIAKKLCNTTVKATGIAYGDIRSLYELLRHWRKNILPPKLQQPIDRQSEVAEKARVAMTSTPIAAREARLQRAVLWALEIKCYLQIEECVAWYGLREGVLVHTDAIALCTEHKSLKVALEAVDLARAIKENHPCDADLDGKPLVDLAPSILRDSCAEVCLWICSRGKRPSGLLEDQTRVNHSRPLGEQCLQTPEQIHTRGRRADYAKIAKSLRDAVAAALSHRDTEQMVIRLDDQIASLEAD
ncbi:hypothetical protein N7499_006323 [Penicillium canescens]|nr:hypothetical protein N7499_006323 [Penicillium canescens]KAJ6176754.1 hypothetical protein N7485_003668 [Penicillium canescens]